MEFGNRLVAKRKEKGITQFELAKVLSVNQSTISDYETGQMKPSMENLIKLAKYFDCTLDELLSDEIENVVLD